MFLLLTGASGAGKTAARIALARALPELEGRELAQLAAVPAMPDLAWRQRTTEIAVRRALQLQAQGRDFLLGGDPVAIGEVLAAPSADRLDGFAACLLDCAPEAQLARLRGRGDPPETFEAHVAFAAWMRGHARDPRHRPEVLMRGGWEAMRWERLTQGEPRWDCTVVDTTGRTLQQVAVDVLAWAEQALKKRAAIGAATAPPERPRSTSTATARSPR